ncbi:hypothetical protein SAMN05443429_10568 [Cruoricaptor ignavus]|uniref:PIN domain-containing protein n=1 Tax=Cruoricaptor ignavus TaxID=1118202 RepID=A0A1M6ED73_9FLAO|nr:PIN domain-containing protein [Cruoricaptor ignavus]SHI83383.1 hypothetical protein SAMN05443429_10568 [Cruoricaptor ignavus]
MISKIFFDTNAIMDFLGERKGALEIGKIISISENRAWKIFISPVSIATTFYLLTKTLGKETALQKIKLFKQFSCVSEINDEVVNKAINSDFSDFEDALQYSAPWLQVAMSSLQKMKRISAKQKFRFSTLLIF